MCDQLDQSRYVRTCVEFGWLRADVSWVASSPESTNSVGGALRTGVVGTVVAAFAFFDAVFLGAPIALLAASLSPGFVFVGAACGVSVLSIACCGWVDRRWGAWSSAQSQRIEKRLETMRTSRLLRRPLTWVQNGSDGSYALAAAVANPILVAALARSIGGKPIGDRRILLGSIAYAIPYVAIWSLAGAALGSALHSA